MPHRSVKTLYALGLAALAAGALAGGLFLNRPAKAQPPLSQPPHAEAWKDLLYDKSSECSRCHVAPTAQDIRNNSLDFVLLTESSIWRTHDKHAQAYAVLLGPRGRQIGKLLWGDEKAVLKSENGCLSCHAMFNVLDKTAAETEEQQLDFLRDGVSCGGCHGPSSKKGGGGWLGEHIRKTWRDKPAEEKYQMGMRNLRDPAVRAELCMSCHVGNAREGKVVTHPMMAAGHPPLPPIEIATFSKNMPQHWRDARHVPYLDKNRDNEKIAGEYQLKYMDFQQTRLALIGNVVAVRETLQLARDRSSFGKAERPSWVWPEVSVKGGDAGQEVPARWPEIAMAHSECYACHHDLRYPGYRQVRGFGYHLPGVGLQRIIPGRPPVRTWSLAGLSAGARYAGRDDLATARKRVAALAAATNSRPFGNPAAVRSTSAELAAWCDRLVKDLHAAPFTRAKVLQLANNLCNLYETNGKTTWLPDYETARQIASILRVAARELKVSAEARKQLVDLTDELNLEPYLLHRDDRLEVMRDVIWNAANKNRPAQDEPDAGFVKGFKEFKDYLKKLRTNREFTQQEIESLERNDFLTAVARRVDNESFTRALLQPKVVKQLQEYSDAEERKVLRAIANYRPREFVNKLHELGRLLPKR